MSESNNLPQAISHKKLTHLMLHAQKELHSSDDTINTFEFCLLYTSPSPRDRG